MNLRVIEEFYIGNIYDLRKILWGGAIDTIDKIIDEGKEDEFLEFFECLFDTDEPKNLTKINDVIWFENEAIYEYIGIDYEK